MMTRRLALLALWSLGTAAVAAGQPVPPLPPAPPPPPALPEPGAAPAPRPGAPASPAAAALPPAGPGTRPTTAPAASPFDAYDPEIRAIGQLDWRKADFNSLDVANRAPALVALNRVLDVAGSKADARADLLVEYLDKNNLGPAYTAETSAEDTKPAITYDDAKKIAAAFIQSPQGRQQFGDEFARTPPNELPKYLELYEKTCRRKFDDVAEARGQVRAMGKFLERQGKLDDFLAWSASETQRRQKEHDAELAIKADERAKEEAARRAEAVAAADRRREADAQRKQELALRQLDYAYQQARTADDGRQYSTAGGYYGDYYDWGYVWTPGVYYAGDAYRAAARNRINNAWGRWGHAGNPAPNRPAPRSAPGVWSRPR